MRILLIANYLPDAQQSMRRFAGMLEAGFAKAGHEVRQLRPSVRAGSLARNESGVKWLGYIDKLVLFPKVLREAIEWAEIVHICDHSNSVYVKYLEERPHVITCHDLLAIRSAQGEISLNETRWSGRRLQSMILGGLRRARQIACVSDATREDVLRMVPGAGAEGKEVTRIYNGLNYPYSPMDRNEAGPRLQGLGLAPDRPFLLHVGGNQWYKNRMGVLRIFAQLHAFAVVDNLALAMVGKPWTEEMRRFIRSHALESAVVELRDVAEEDLRALYSSAELMLFPSLAEGFGWPIIEAQACGCPVVASNLAPMTEVGGDAAIYIDPSHSESAAMGVGGALKAGSALRFGLREAGLRNAARFSTEAMIEAYLGLYERVAGAWARELPRRVGYRSSTVALR
jgi:glycosyltransferase involved in cell wall biosynthesis